MNITNRVMKATKCCRLVSIIFEIEEELVV